MAGVNNNLIPPIKGEVRNPKGKPKGTQNARTRYRRILELISKKTNPVTGLEEEFTQIELMDIAIFNKALRGDLGAYKEIMDRYEGKVTDKVEMNTTANVGVVMHDQVRNESVFNKQDE